MVENQTLCNFLIHCNLKVVTLHRASKTFLWCISISFCRPCSFAILHRCCVCVALAAPCLWLITIMFYCLDAQARFLASHTGIITTAEECNGFHMCLSKYPRDNFNCGCNGGLFLLLPNNNCHFQHSTVVPTSAFNLLCLTGHNTFSLNHSSPVSVIIKGN